MCGPLAALQIDTSVPGDVDSEARFTDCDGESFVYEANGSFVGSIFDDGSGEIMPEDSISMKNVHRGPYGKLASLLAKNTFTAILRADFLLTQDSGSDGERSDDETIYLGKRSSERY